MHVATKWTKGRMPAMALLLAAGCAPDLVPHRLSLELEAQVVVIEAPVGGCAEGEVALRNGGTLDLAVDVGPAILCGLDLWSPTLGLAPGASAVVPLRHCPVVEQDCRGSLPVRYDDGLASGELVVELILGAVALDVDQDGASVADGDCDDLDADVGPGALELENGLDDDCDGVTDEGTARADDDGDGFCEGPGPCSSGDLGPGDCDDAHPGMHPHATEVDNGLDDDCDGWVDEDTSVSDDDGDGYSEAEGDCNDGNPDVFPLATESPFGTPDGIDNDCDQDIDEVTP